MKMMKNSSAAGSSSRQGMTKMARASTARRASVQTAAAIRDGATLDRPLRVAVIGGGPSGACAAETLAAGGVETFLIERKMDNCKVRVQSKLYTILIVFSNVFMAL
jgi:geranylgeranyl reductase